MSTSLLLEFEGADGSTSITDSSGIAKTITIGGTAAITTGTALYGSGSLNLSQAGSSYVKIDQSASELSLTGDFSIHFGFRRTLGGAGRRLLAAASGNFYVGLDGTGGNLQMVIVGSDTNGGSGFSSALSFAPLNEWHTFGMVRKESLYRVFIDGVRFWEAIGSGAPHTLNMSGSFLGRAASGGSFFTGQLDKVLIDKGTALWTWGYDPMTLVARDDLTYRALTQGYKSEAFSPTWPVSPKLIKPNPKLLNVYYGGRGRIAGTVKVKGTPNYAVYRKVRLYRERDGICVAEQWSDPITGNYSFDYWDQSEKYTVISYDYTNNFRAVIADNITPDLIP